MFGIFPVLILVIASFVQCYSTDNTFRSSYLTIWDDKVLLGHVITVHYVDGITLCAHDCLSKPGCQSFNFGKDSNLCELNNSSLQHRDLASKASFLHGSLIIVPIIKFVFTTLGAQGPTGPTNTSGYLGTTLEGKVLLGHVITVHYVDGITLCAHDCLSKPGCQSFNFGKDSNLCELNNSSLQHRDLASKASFLHGSLIIVPIIKFVFTTLGAQGPTGPTNTSGYLGTTLEGHVRLKNGIQEWTVPHTGTYYIEAFGASGANGTCSSCLGWRLGGLGAKITGSFELERGQRLKILVGQEGQISFKFKESPGGGGGGTFVTFMDNSPLVVAGGGGGAPVSIAGNLDGDPGQAGQEGSRHGGKAGSGGRLSDPNLMAGTGAGIWGDGKGVNGMAMSFKNGGISANVDLSKGGFGGGGYGLLLPGGGGGYSGGGVEGNHPSSAGTAGGGGSINNGTSQINESGVNEGDGKVIITLIN